MNSKPSILASALFLALPLLTSCAAGGWEQPIYEGMRNAGEQCRLTRRPDAAPCAELPSFDRYEAEREAARGARSSASPSMPAR